MGLYLDPADIAAGKVSFVLVQLLLAALVRKNVLERHEVHSFISTMQSRSDMKHGDEDINAAIVELLRGLSAIYDVTPRGPRH